MCVMYRCLLLFHRREGVVESLKNIDGSSETVVNTLKEYLAMNTTMKSILQKVTSSLHSSIQTVPLKAHAHPSSFACPVFQKNDFVQLKIATFRLCACRVTLLPSVKKVNVLCPIEILNQTKEAFQNKNTSVQSCLGEHRKKQLTDSLLWTLQGI